MILSRFKPPWCYWSSNSTLQCLDFTFLSQVMCFSSVLSCIFCNINPVLHIMYFLTSLSKKKPHSGYFPSTWQHSDILSSSVVIFFYSGRIFHLFGRRFTRYGSVPYSKVLDQTYWHWSGIRDQVNLDRTQTKLCMKLICFDCRLVLGRRRTRPKWHTCWACINRTKIGLHYNNVTVVSQDYES